MIPYSDFRSGQRATCRIEGNLLSGEIFKDENAVYIFQDEVDGSHPDSYDSDEIEDFNGFSYSWLICKAGEDYIDGLESVTDLQVEGIEVKEKECRFLHNASAGSIITLGSDPEFTIVDSVKDKIIGADDIFKPEGDPLKADMGYDGHMETAEIRPKPAKTPKEAVENIKKILEKSKAKYPQMYQNNLLASHTGISLGGHIQFGHEDFRGDTEKSRENIKILVKNLDTLLAFPCLFLEDEKIARERRDNYGYGKMSDWRSQSWGFEYRTLPSFIASKEVTTSIFYLAHAIAEATMHNGFQCKNIREIRSFDMAFNQCAKELLRPFLPKVFRQYKCLPLYKSDPKYKESIDKFIVMVKKSEPILNTEMKQGWGIEFDFSEYWKVEKIETLLRSLTKLLITLHTKRLVKSKDSISFVDGSVLDTGCMQIAEFSNLALNKIIDTNVKKTKAWQKVRVVGLKEERGNAIYIGSMKLSEKTRKYLLSTAWEVASLFPHNTKIESVEFSDVIKPFTIGFGSAIRKENILLAECLAVMASLLVNRELYKQKEKIRGKNKKLYLTKNKVVKPVRDIIQLAHLKEVKPIVRKWKRLGNIELPYFFDENSTYNTIYSTILGLDDRSLRQVAEALIPLRKLVAKQYLENPRFKDKYISDEKPFKKMSKSAFYQTLYNIVRNLPPTTSSSPINNGFLNHYSCGECKDNLIYGTWCHNCGYCLKHCECPIPDSMKAENLEKFDKIRKKYLENLDKSEVYKKSK